MTALFLLPTVAAADTNAGISLQMHQRGAGGFYVHGVFAGGIESDLLVDSGSSYIVLSRQTFARLENSGATAFARTIHGTTAAGRSMEARVYSIAELALSEACILRDVEAVVLRNADRDILGLSALRRLQPFSLSFEPAELRTLSCRELSENELPVASDPT